MIPTEYVAYHPRFVNMLEEFQNRWYDHPVQINSASYEVDLSSPGARSIHSVPYRPGSKEGDAEKEEITKC